jgi:hypothetical protein
LAEFQLLENVTVYDIAPSGIEESEELLDPPPQAVSVMLDTISKAAFQFN